jgi:hypothetical protein
MKTIKKIIKNNGCTLHETEQQELGGIYLITKSASIIKSSGWLRNCEWLENGWVYRIQWRGSRLSSENESSESVFVYESPEEAAQALIKAENILSVDDWGYAVLKPILSQPKPTAKCYGCVWLSPESRFCAVNPRALKAQECPDREIPRPQLVKKPVSELAKSNPLAKAFLKAGVVL